jgi:hypothetical protein
MDLAARRQAQRERAVAVSEQHVAHGKQPSRVVGGRVVGDVAGEVDGALAIRLRGRGRFFRGAPR